MIRPIAPADADAVAAIARSARFDAIPGLPDLHTLAEDRAFYRSQIESGSGRVWVQDDGAVVGFILWLGDFIDHLYVDPDHQRSGIGTRLLHQALAQMQGEVVKLWTFQENARAVAFYARNGFDIQDATDGSANAERLPDYLLVRR